MYKKPNPIGYLSKLDKWYNNKTLNQILDLIIEFDSNPETSDFNKFLKNKGYK